MSRTDLYVNGPPGGMKPHLFRAGDVRDATLNGSHTDDPVTSVCGTVRSYGPFQDADNVAGEAVCGNCTNKTDDSER